MRNVGIMLVIQFWVKFPKLPFRTHPPGKSKLHAAPPKTSVNSWEVYIPPITPGIGTQHPHILPGKGKYHEQSIQHDSLFWEQPSQKSHLCIWVAVLKARWLCPEVSDLAYLMAFLTALICSLLLLLSLSLGSNTKNILNPLFPYKNGLIIICYLYISTFQLQPKCLIMITS